MKIELSPQVTMEHPKDCLPVINLAVKDVIIIKGNNWISAYVFMQNNLHL
jgi:hypothetical protein